jgi:hypothetical protein
MSTFDLSGHHLAYFSAWKDYIGMYPLYMDGGEIKELFALYNKVDNSFHYHTMIRSYMESLRRLRFPQKRRSRTSITSLRNKEKQRNYMSKIGILVHCRNLSTIAWEEMVYGLPEEEKLGDLATLVRVILTLAPDDEVTEIIVGRGPSQRDGLDEGDYTKKFFINKLDTLGEFETLQPLLNSLGDDGRLRLRALIENITVSDPIISTLDEMVKAAAIFNESGVDKVIQISAASHAPRCVKEQTVLREKGVISNSQLWFSVATDITYHNTKPGDVCVIEPLHRLDQPLTSVRPGLSEVIAPYFAFNDDDKKAFIKAVNEFMTTRNHLP